ncbi:class I SAM-dependent methyltransferase [Pseudomonas syringae]|uniref:class I SAM-dependent methyltransferase n=1 Tax=Pseudomonas syringae TaxID=317 RepID=UPI001E329CF7|nr:class I SAM-dependent methyltransferase [Pseudomonas syringae]UZS64843.1 class I SAM-dependent methyltransferase [Pseudomonas syringae]
MMLTSQKNIIKMGVPSRTAFQVAELRAAHQLLDEPIIFNDPVAFPILGEQAATDLRQDPFQSNDLHARGIRAVVVARSRLTEDELERFVQSGVKQYVVLGAGLDTFALRNNYLEEGLHVFEVDHPSTQEWKRNLLEEASIKVPDSLTFVAVDFESSTLAEELQKAGFRADQPAFFSWLGVTIYISQEAMLDTLKFVASLPKGSGIIFDYGVTPTLLDPIDNAIGDYLVDFIAQLGEPWKTWLDPVVIENELQSMGFQSIRDYDSIELNELYLARRKDGLRMGGTFRLICAKT